MIFTEIDEKSDTVDVKGLECVRRDTIPLVRDLMNKTLEVPAGVTRPLCEVLSL